MTEGIISLIRFIGSSSQVMRLLFLVLSEKISYFKLLYQMVPMGKITIRVDKCITLGIKKFSTCSMQLETKLLINSETVPPVQKGTSLRYFSCHFNFEMNNDEHMSSLQSSFPDMLSEIDSLSILPQNRLRFYQTYLLSKASWDFTVTTISKTWIIHNLDNLVSHYIREWLELPISATLSRIISLKISLH